MKQVSCAEAHRDLWLYIDRELSASELQAISRHLKDCDACRAAYHERAREASQYRTTFLDTPFGDQFVDKLRRRMSREGLLESLDRRAAGRSSAGRAGARKGSGPRNEDDTELLVVGAAGGDAGRGRRDLGSRLGRLFSLRSAPFRRRFLRIATVAAMIVLIPAVVIIGKLYNSPPLESLGTLSVADGSAFTVLSEDDLGKIHVVVPEGARHTVLQPGLIYAVPGNGVAHLKLSAWSSGSADLDGPTPSPAAVIELRGPARLAIDAQATRKRFHALLESGSFGASVEHRDPLEPFVVDTPHATASVVGTRFVLTAGKSETRLSVSEGTVKLEKRDSLPGARESAMVTRETGEFVQRERERAPVPVAVATTAPAAPAIEAAAPAAAPAVTPAVTPNSGSAKGSAPVAPVTAPEATPPPQLDDPVDGTARPDPDR